MELREIVAKGWLEAKRKGVLRPVEYGREMLERETIQLWTVALDAEKDAAEGWYGALLSGEERARADAFATEQLRRRSVTAHAALRVVLGQVLGVAASAVEFERAGRKEMGGGTRKPALALAGDGRYTGVGMVERADVGKNGVEVGFPGTRTGESGYGKASPVRFNLSHSGRMALIGVARGFEIGVDIERHRPDQDLAQVAEIVMSDREKRDWSAMSEEDRFRGFFRLWTRKEAYIKATGLGLFADLKRITVPVTPGMLTRPCTVEDAAGRGIWMTADVDAPAGYSASVCWEGSAEVRIRMAELGAEDMA